jgi:hypothetical protein
MPNGWQLAIPTNHDLLSRPEPFSERWAAVPEEMNAGPKKTKK